MARFGIANVDYRIDRLPYGNRISIGKIRFQPPVEHPKNLNRLKYKQRTDLTKVA